MHLENSDDFEQLSVQAIFSYRFTKYGQEQFYNCKMRL